MVAVSVALMPVFVPVFALVVMAVALPMATLMLIVPMIAAAWVQPNSVFMPMSMPFMPIGRAFGPFGELRFELAGVTHWWLPGSICGLVNTLKPLQGQDRYPEGP
jgi:hypothetical protein